MQKHIVKIHPLEMVGSSVKPNTGKVLATFHFASKEHAMYAMSMLRNKSLRNVPMYHGKQTTI